MKHIFHDILPPILWRFALKSREYLRNFANREQEFEYGVEQPPEFYDQIYESAQHWKDHYVHSRYYSLWTVIADRIRHARIKRVLDIGCGPGQVACLLRDLDVPEYTGLDFSTARIARARAVCPEYDFVAADVFENKLLETYPYDCVLLLEFLEHIKEDINVLKRVRPGTTVLLTVPNFPAQGHVRHFASVNEVEIRYSALFSQLEVAEILSRKRGNSFFILQGTR